MQERAVYAAQSLLEADLRTYAAGADGEVNKGHDHFLVACLLRRADPTPRCWALAAGLFAWRVPWSARLFEQLAVPPIRLYLWRYAHEGPQKATERLRASADGAAECRPDLLPLITDTLSELETRPHEIFRVGDGFKKALLEWSGERICGEDLPDKDYRVHTDASEGTAPQ